MNKTKIEWVVDPDGSPGYTWNPVTGCRHGCEYCYAEKIAKRFKGHFKPTFYRTRLHHPFKRKKPTTFFVGSMSDLFGKWFPDTVIEDVLKTAWQCTQHKFLFLTKNPKRYKNFEFPSNCWLGTTVTSMDDAWRINKMRKLDNNFLSCEPLLGDLSGADLRGIKWIIIGSLNRNGRAVPMDKGGTRKEWVEALVEEADIRDIPVFVKDLLWVSPILKEWRELPYLDTNCTNLHKLEEREKADVDG